MPVQSLLLYRHAAASSLTYAAYGYRELELASLCEVVPEVLQPQDLQVSY